MDLATSGQPRNGRKRVRRYLDGGYPTLPQTLPHADAACVGERTTSFKRPAFSNSPQIHA